MRPCVCVCVCFPQCPAAPQVERAFLRSASPFHVPLEKGPLQGVSDPVSTLSWTSCSSLDVHLTSQGLISVCKTKRSRTSISKTSRLRMKESPGALSKERNPAALGLLKQGLKKQQSVLGICFTSSGKLGAFAIRSL